MRGLHGRCFGPIAPVRPEDGSRGRLFHLGLLVALANGRRHSSKQHVLSLSLERGGVQVNFTGSKSRVWIITKESA